MSGDLDGSQQALLFCCLAFFRITESGQRPNTDSFPKRCVSKNKIPTIARPKIRLGERNGGESIGGKFWRENFVKNMAGQKLVDSPRRMLALRRCGNDRLGQCFVDDNFTLKVDREKFGTGFDQFIVGVSEFPNRLDVELVSASREDIGT